MCFKKILEKSSEKVADITCLAGDISDLIMVSLIANHREQRNKNYRRLSKKQINIYAVFNDMDYKIYAGYITIKFNIFKSC